MHLIYLTTLHSVIASVIRFKLSDALWPFVLKNTSENCIVSLWWFVSWCMENSCIPSCNWAVNAVICYQNSPKISHIIQSWQSGTAMGIGTTISSLCPDHKIWTQNLKNTHTGSEPKIHPFLRACFSTYPAWKEDRLIGKVSFPGWGSS